MTPLKGLAALFSCLSLKSIRDLSDFELQADSFSSLALIDVFYFWSALSPRGKMLLVLRRGAGFFAISTF